MLVQSQHYRKDEEDDPNALPQKLGIKIGISPTWVNAPGMVNTRTQVGLQGGFYYRINLNRKNIHLHTEVTANFRGARFDNGKEGYSRLGLFYMDIPVYLMISFDKKQDHNLLFGPVFSHLVRPTLFVYDDPLPRFSDLPLKRYDIAAGLTYIRSFELIGLSVGFKYGLSNIVKSSFAEFGTPSSSGTKAIYLKDIQPSLAPVNSIKNLGFEFSLYF